MVTLATTVKRLRKPLINPVLAPSDVVSLDCKIQPEQPENAAQHGSGARSTFRAVLPVLAIADKHLKCGNARYGVKTPGRGAGRTRGRLASTRRTCIAASTRPLLRRHR